VSYATQEYLEFLDRRFPTLDRAGDYDLGAALQRVRDIQSELARCVGHPLELDRNVQDASHFADLYMLGSECNELVHGRYRTVQTVAIAIRFSSFGDLGAVWGSDNSAPLQPDRVEAIHQVLPAHGYHPVSDELLAAPYSGQLTDVDGRLIRTWWDRFFDYY
jgi:hypothetical protein